MEIEVGFDEGFRVAYRLVHFLYGLAHGCDVFRIGARRTEGCNFRLQDFANFYEVGPAILLTGLDNAVERTPHAIRGSAGHKCAAAWECVDQSFFLECFYGFANGGPADAELLGEFALGGELAAFCQLAPQDGVLNLLNDLLVEARRLDDLVQGVRPRSLVFSALRGCGKTQNPVIPSEARNLSFLDFLTLKSKRDSSLRSE